MKNKTPKQSSSTKPSSFYESLQQKYKNTFNRVLSNSTTNRQGSYQPSSFTSTIGSTSHSRAKENKDTRDLGSTGKKCRGVSQSNNKAKKEVKDAKESRDVETVLHVGANIVEEDRALLRKDYKILDATDNVADIISQSYSQCIKLLSILIQPCSSSSSSSLTSSSSECPKSSQIYKYLDPLLKKYKKSTLCIYSLGPSGNDFYDMLSIRKQMKKETKLLVQTNICNNSKSSAILRKLIDVAMEREKSMINVLGSVRAVVVRVKAVCEDTQDENMSHNVNAGNGKANNQNTNAHNNGSGGKSREIEIEMSVGDYGEIGYRDLMGTQRLRKYMTILDMSQLQSIQQMEPLICHLHMPQKPQKQSELLVKIRCLQEQLKQKKRELEEQKERVANEQAIQAQLQDIVLPSERPMIDIKKYSTTKWNIKERYAKTRTNLQERHKEDHQKDNPNEGEGFWETGVDEF